MAGDGHSGSSDNSVGDPQSCSEDDIAETAGGEIRPDVDRQ